jgi:hypothetical protein
MRNLMNGTRLMIGAPARGSLMFLSVLALTLGLGTSPAAGQQPGQQTFASPGEAVEAMITAAKAGDTDALLHIFGSNSKEVLSSGDPVADKNHRVADLARYDQMHRLVKEPDGTVTLYMGAENWPFPIPLVQKNNAWYFDTAAGKEEILFRRIGRNELATIDACRAMADAQKQYASEPHDGEPAGEYALKLVSDPGKHNGLYWKAAADEPQSPIGPLVVQAMSEGYGGKGPTPFHGYIYKRLDGQGPDAPGGAKEYIVNGKKTGGFAFLAYPAEYRNSGVMTFIVNQDGIVYQKDLGPETAKTAKSMTEFSPDKSWQPVQN